MSFSVVIFRRSLGLGLFLSAGVGLRTEFDRLALIKNWSLLEYEVDELIRHEVQY